MGTMNNATRIAIQSCLLLLTLAALAPMGGCRKSLFTERDVRSQYDQYDRVRNQYEPPFVFDEFGDEVPNVKGRLSPKR